MDDYTKDSLIRMSDGSLVERDVLNIVEKIRSYDENLVLKYNDGSGTDISEAPYRLFEKCRDGFERLVFEIWELDERVLERLYAADNAKNNVFVDMEGRNLITREQLNRRYKEDFAEAEDIVVHYLKNPKSRWSFIAPDTGNKVTIDDQEGIPAKVEKA